MTQKYVNTDCDKAVKEKQRDQGKQQRTDVVWQIRKSFSGECKDEAKTLKTQQDLIRWRVDVGEVRRPLQAEGIDVSSPGGKKMYGTFEELSINREQSEGGCQ